MLASCLLCGWLILASRQVGRARGAESGCAASGAGGIGKRENAAAAEKVLSLLEEILCLYPSGASDWEGFIYNFSDLP